MGIILLLVTKAAFNFLSETYVIHFLQTEKNKIVGDPVGQFFYPIKIRKRIPILRPVRFFLSLSGFCRVLESVFRGLAFVVSVLLFVIQDLSADGPSGYLIFHLYSTFGILEVILIQGTANVLKSNDAFAFLFKA